MQCMPGAILAEMSPAAFWLVGYEHSTRRRRSGDGSDRKRQRALLPHHPLLLKIAKQFDGIEVFIV